jgi:YfiH family protein
MTDQPGVMVTVRTADCVPVLLHDPARRAVAAVHAGWRGALGGIVPRTIATMAERFGSVPAALRVAVGPSAGPCCYEVDEPVLAGLRASVPDWPSVLRVHRPGRALLDLRLLVRLQAEAAGVPADSIQAVNLCTICRPALFHSYRRDGEVRGTMVSGIMLTGRRPPTGRPERAGRLRPVNRRRLPVQ